MLTGRDLIMYIIANHLEDEPIVKDGCFMGFMDEMEAGVRFNVGRATIRAWVAEGILSGIKLGENVYIPINAKPKKIEHKDTRTVSVSLHLF